MIVVPHRELGVQICMLIYRLIGGSVNKGIPGERATMFSYFGPRGVQVLTAYLTLICPYLPLPTLTYPVLVLLLWHRSLEPRSAVLPARARSIVPGRCRRRATLAPQLPHTLTACPAAASSI